MTVTDRPARPARPRTLLTVLGSEWLTPTMVRVRFHAPGFQPNGLPEAYVKLIFGDDGPLLEDLPERPTTRTYTVSGYDAATETVSLDFVVHGAEGLAAPWAARCTPGERVLANGPGGKWAPPADADWHLFVGDESAIPAIAGAIAQLPADARGLAVIEVADHVVDFAFPDGVEVRWLVRGEQPYREEWLAEVVAALPWDDFGDVSVFAHGERGAMKALRPVLRDIDRGRVSISGYWALGRVEDQFQAEKRTEIGQI